MTPLPPPPGALLDEHDIGIVVWVNPRAAAGSPTAAYLSAVVGVRTGRPLARPIYVLCAEPTLRRRPVLMSAEDVSTWLAPPFGGAPLATRERPVIVPVPIARLVLGIEAFEIALS